MHTLFTGFYQKLRLYVGNQLVFLTVHDEYWTRRLPEVFFVVESVRYETTEEFAHYSNGRIFKCPEW